jgi:hypothetical protein
VFPVSPDRWPDVDAYFFRVKAGAVGGLLMVNVALIVFATIVVVDGGDLAGTGRRRRNRHGRLPRLPAAAGGAALDE